MGLGWIELNAPLLRAQLCGSAALKIVSKGEKDQYKKDNMIWVPQAVFVLFVFCVCVDCNAYAIKPLA